MRRQRQMTGPEAMRALAAVEELLAGDVVIHSVDTTRYPGSDTTLKICTVGVADDGVSTMKEILTAAFPALEAGVRASLEKRREELRRELGVSAR